MDVLAPSSRARWLVAALMAAVILAGATALVVGGVSIELRHAARQAWLGLTATPTDPVAAQIILHVRLPRILLAISVGATMGLAGLAAQTLFRNPLASPYVMGISNGAAVGAVLGMLLVGRGMGYAAVPLLAIAAGLLAAAGAFALASAAASSLTAFCWRAWQSAPSARRSRPPPCISPASAFRRLCSG